MFFKKVWDLVLGDVIRSEHFENGAWVKEKKQGDCVRIGLVYTIGGQFEKMKAAGDYTRKTALYVIEALRRANDECHEIFARRLNDDDGGYDPEGELIWFTARPRNSDDEPHEVDYFGRMNRDRTMIVYEIPSATKP